MKQKKGRGNKKRGNVTARQSHLAVESTADSKKEETLSARNSNNKKGNKTSRQ